MIEQLGHRDLVDMGNASDDRLVKDRRHRLIERQFALIGEAQDRHRRERLVDAAHVKAGRGRDRLIGFDAGEARACGRDLAVGGFDENAQAWPAALHHFGHRAVDGTGRLGSRGDRRQRNEHGECSQRLEQPVLLGSRPFSTRARWGCNSRSPAASAEISRRSGGGGGG
jgi:hypothetical protein